MRKYFFIFWWIIILLLTIFSIFEISLLLLSKPSTNFREEYYCIKQNDCGVKLVGGCCGSYYDVKNNKDNIIIRMNRKNRWIDCTNIKCSITELPKFKPIPLCIKNQCSEIKYYNYIGYILNKIKINSLWSE